MPVDALRARLRRDGSVRRRHRAARPADSRPRARRHPFRDGIPDAAEPPLRRRRRFPTRSSSRPKGKRVVIIGGGDTGADCLGTAHRQGARVGRTSSSCCRGRPRRARPTIRGRCGRTIFRTLLGARGRGRAAVFRSRPSVSSATSRAASRALQAVQRRDACGTAAACGSCRFPGASSRSRPTSCCWRWAFSGPERGRPARRAGRAA